MKFVINIILFLNLIHNIFSVIPNWNLSAIGENLLTSDSYTWTKTMEYDNKYAYLDVIFTKENGSIKKKNQIRIGDRTNSVDFDDIQSFYYLKGQYYICPKGSYHVYDFYSNQNIQPKDVFIDNGGEKFQLKCVYHYTSNIFLVFYLYNGGSSIYGVHMIDSNSMKYLKHISYVSADAYDFRINYDTIGNNEYYMLGLIQQDSNIRISQIKATLKSDSQSVNQIGSKDFKVVKNHVQSYFKVSNDNINDFFFISYNNLTDFISGYTTYAPDYKDVSDTDVSTSKAEFEFFEDVDIEEMNFLPYNRYVYYKMKKNDSSTIYYGIYDTKLNNVIFNTEEKLKYYLPISDREMLVVTDNSIHKICPMRDANNDQCVDYCENNYLLNTQGNRCNDANECKPGEVMLVPSFVCNQTCDENIYHFNGTHCGLCKYLNSYGNQFKLMGAQGCKGTPSDSMDIYSERLGLLKCKEGYILNGTDCIPNITCFERCESCYNNSDNIDDQKCLTCKEEFLIENNNCLKNCSKGYEKTEEKRCRICDHQNTCTDFETNTCNCLKCISLFFVNSSKMCEECDTNCKDCFGTSTNCTSCSDKNFLYNSTCYQCVDNNICDKYLDDSKKCECEKCKDGFYNSKYECINCVNNCTTCSNSSKCEICQDGYFLNSEGLCEQCPTTCATTKQDKCHCETCIEHYFMNSSEECQECNSLCKNCEGNAENCTECVDKYFLNEDNKCEECDELCKTCSEIKTNCTSCADGLYMTKENKCEQCDNKCLTCSGGESECLSCDQSDSSEYKYLINDYLNKTCVKNCTESGREFSGNSFECKPLNKNGTNGGDTDKEKGNVDYLLWIFIAIVGIVLIIITICIIKKCCTNKNSDLVEEISQELSEKDEIIN